MYNIYIYNILYICIDIRMLSRIWWWWSHSRSTNWRDQQFQTCWKRPGAFDAGGTPVLTEWLFSAWKKRSLNRLSVWRFQFFFNFHPYLGKMSNLTNIFQTGWNHQPVVFLLLESESVKQTQHIFLNPPWSSTASLPLKRHQSPKGKDRLPVPSFFRGC